MYLLAVLCLISAAAAMPAGELPAPPPPSEGKVDVVKHENQKPKQSEGPVKFIDPGKFDDFKEKGDKFEEPKKGFKEDKFEEPKKHAKENKFVGSKKDSKEDKFEKPKKDSKEDKFEEPKKDSKEDKFEESKKDSKEDKFEKSKKDSKEDKFGEPKKEESKKNKDSVEIIKDKDIKYIKKIDDSKEFKKPDDIKESEKDKNKDAAKEFRKENDDDKDKPVEPAVTKKPPKLPALLEWIFNRFPLNKIPFISNRFGEKPKFLIDPEIVYDVDGDDFGNDDIPY